MIIKPATEKYLQQVFDLLCVVLKEISYYNEVAKENEKNKYTFEKLKNKIKNDKYSVLIAVENETVVGACLNNNDDFTIWLEWILVEKSFRKHKIGNLLLTKLEDYSKTRACHKIWCDCRTSNETSLKFLIHNNYEIITELKNHWYKLDFYIMQKFL